MTKTSNIINLKEVNGVRFRCGNCQMTMEFTLDRMELQVLKCPCCHSEFSYQYNSLLSSLYNILHRIHNIADDLTPTEAEIEIVTEIETKKEAI